MIFLRKENFLPTLGSCFIRYLSPSLLVILPDTGRFIIHISKKANVPPDTGKTLALIIKG